MSIESIQTGTVASAIPKRPTAPPPTVSVAEQRNTVTETTNPSQPKSEQKLSLEEAVSNISKFVSLANAEISFSIDQSSGTRVVQIKDSRSDTVIRQIPSEEAIQIAQALDKLQGLFVKESA